MYQKEGSKMTVQLTVFQEFIEEAQTIYLEDIREGTHKLLPEKGKRPRSL